MGNGDQSADERLEVNRGKEQVQPTSSNGISGNYILFRFGHILWEVGEGVLLIHIRIIIFFFGFIRFIPIPI